MLRKSEDVYSIATDNKRCLSALPQSVKSRNICIMLLQENTVVCNSCHVSPMTLHVWALVNFIYECKKIQITTISNNLYVHINITSVYENKYNFCAFSVKLLCTIMLVLKYHWWRRDHSWGTTPIIKVQIEAGSSTAMWNTTTIHHMEWIFKHVLQQLQRTHGSKAEDHKQIYKQLLENMKMS